MSVYSHRGQLCIAWRIRQQTNNRHLQLRGLGETLLEVGKISRNQNDARHVLFQSAFEGFNFTLT